MSKAKILFILHLPPPVHGASVVGRYIKESEDINSAFDCDYVNLTTAKSLDSIGAKGIGKAFALFQILLRAARKVSLKRYDLCYVTLNSKGIGFYKDTLVVLLLKLFGRRLVFHFHNKGVRSRQDRYFDNILYKWVFSHSSVILLSKLLYSDIEKYVPPGRVQYCPNGIADSNPGKAVARLENEAVRILFFSNMIESKGVYVLLKACQILKGRGARFKCVFVGGWGDISEDCFKAEVEKLDLADRIVSLGAKYGKDKEECFRNADIFAFPSFDETFGLVLIEAMQHRLPIVATAVGGIPDVVEDGRNGFLCPQKDPVALAEKLEILLKDPKLRETMGAEGYRKYKEKYTLEVFESRLKTILANLAGDRPLETVS